jgi:hypothetical protein
MKQSLAKFLSLPTNFKFICDSPNETEKKKRIAELKKKFEQTSNFATFSAGYVEDFGNPESAESGIYDDCSTFAEYSAKAREVSAFERIKSIVSVSNIRENAKQWALQKNEIVRRNKAKKAERDAQKKDKFLSHPGWF